MPGMFFSTLLASKILSIVFKFERYYKNYVWKAFNLEIRTFKAKGQQKKTVVYFLSSSFVYIEAKV